MATLLEAYNTKVTNQTLRSRTIAAVAKCSIDILAEDPGTANHAARLTWAKDALINTESATDKIMWAVIADANVLANPTGCTDGQIITAVTNAVNTFAV
jgi:hypothetical protein